MFRNNLRTLTRASIPALKRAAYRIPSPIPFSPKIVLNYAPLSLRFNSTNTASIQGETPQLMIAFTCKKCDTRSSHTFSKQAYHKGLVLIQCPGCKGRHLIADNLNIFRDNKVNLEDILKAQGESVATTTDDLAFEDIPQSLKGVLGRYARNAPSEYQDKDTEQKSIESK
ncbi:hypothetical protein PUMCH_001064 [Australozyma saopauloensis]|uniref:DNL-type domain-containing protein n=1 Tax=Australozyma saopauloensis TaxID=291208 RepID=A0AAX4H774_9ASCO|nr:hypothetical protein PUMCH_001064 [[Candida] saopauloensis]